MIIRVTVPRPESNQPETSVHRLEKLGAVRPGESPCSSSWNPGARSTASLLAQREWVLKSTHFDGGSPLFRGQFQPGKSALKNYKKSDSVTVSAPLGKPCDRPADLHPIVTQEVQPLLVLAESRVILLATATAVPAMPRLGLLLILISRWTVSSHLSRKSMRMAAVPSVNEMNADFMVHLLRADAGMALSTAC
jgi:hypothetical protein